MFHYLINKKTIFLFFVLHVLGLYTLFGANEKVEPSETVSSIGTQTGNNVDSKEGRPRFKRIKVLSKGLQNYIPKISINDELYTGSGKVLKTGFSKEDQSFNVESEGIEVATFRLSLMDKKNDVIVSENKTVYWPNANKAVVLQNIFGNELKGINVKMEQNPDDKESLLIIIEKENKSSDGFVNSLSKMYTEIKDKILNLNKTQQRKE